MQRMRLFHEAKNKIRRRGVSTQQVVESLHTNASAALELPILHVETVALCVVKYTTPPAAALELKDLISTAASELWKPSSVFKSGSSVVTLDTEDRQCSEYNLSKDYLTCHPEDPLRRAGSAIDNVMRSVMNDYRAKYVMHAIESSYTVLLKYDVGGHFVSHYDAARSAPRAVSVTCFLNDDYVGGELYFEHLNITVKPSPGLIIVFPSDYPYRHLVTPIEQGTRYSVVKWYSYV